MPWSPPDNLWLYWGPEVDKSWFGSAQAVRAELKLGNIAGGEFRDRHFLKQFTGQRFRDMTLTCCKVLVFPPLAHGFPIFKAFGSMEHRLSRFVANGNTMVFTGGMPAILFINRIFKMKLEVVNNNYSPGPFVMYEEPLLPKAFRKLPDRLFQENTDVTTVHKWSLPVGTKMIFASVHGTPLFIMKYCEINNPKRGELPLKIQPRYCPKWEKKGHPCACGNIIYVGYNFQDRTNERWNNALRATLGQIIGKNEE